MPKQRDRLMRQFTQRALGKSPPKASINPPGGAAARFGRREGGRDLELGQALAQINERTAPAQIRSAAPSAPTAGQKSSYARSIAPRRGTERAYSTFASKNTQQGSARFGRERRSFVKRNKQGDIYK